MCFTIKLRCVVQSNHYYDGTGAPNKKENANTTYFKMGIANNPIPINNGIKNDCLRFLLNMLICEVFSIDAFDYGYVSPHPARNPDPVS